MENEVTLYRHKEKIVQDAFDRAVFNVCLQKEKYGHKSFTICGCEPGVGTTSIAVELAIALSIAGWHTLLLDGDLRKGNDYKRLNENKKAGLADYIKKDITLTEIIVRTNWDKLEYIPCGDSAEENPLQLLYSYRMAAFINEVYEKYDYIIIDAPSISTSVDAHIFSVKSDATILAAAINGGKKKYLEEAKKQLEKNGANVIGVIENKVPRKEYKQYNRDYDYFDERKFAQKKGTVNK